MLRFTSTLIVHPLSLARLNVERRAIVRQLVGLGYRVAVPKYDFQEAAVLSRLVGNARVFQARSPGVRTIEILGNEKKTAQASALWGRDLWNKIGGKRFKRFTSVGESWLGEGGKAISLPNRSILANKRLEGLSQVKKLQQEGYRFYFVEDGEAYCPPMSAMLKTPVFERHDHVDLFAGCTGNVLLVDRNFFEQNRLIFGKIARETNLQIVFVPRAEETLCPANFLVLEPGKILMDRDAKETIALMREKGVEVIPTAVSMRANRQAGGNVRCIVNEL
jgi:hypothetical protein